MTASSWWLLCIFLGYSLASSDRSWVLAPNFFRCNETEKILIHSLSLSGTCLQLQLKNGINGKVINETKKELLLEKKKEFQLGVFNDHCLNDHVFLHITSYEAEENFGETISSECLNVPIGNHSEYKIPIQRNVGYIFIQTDLPIYRPGQTVRIRVFRLNENMYPINDSIGMIIKDPSNNEVNSKIFHDEADIILTSFKLHENSQIGVWTISTKYTKHKSLKETNIRFLVQEYVTPKFEVHIDVQPKLISKATKLMNVTITAMYFYNKTVEGKVYLQYGNNGDRISGKLEDGHYFKQLKIKGDRCGAFLVSAKVTEKNTRISEYKTDSRANFVNSVPKDENKEFDRRPKREEFYLKKTLEKEYYSQGERVEVVAENCRVVHYCLIGRGRILKCGEESNYSDRSQLITFTLTENTIPMAELMAYCIFKNRITSTASMSFNVLDICYHKKQLQVNILPQKEFYSPQEEVMIQIKGFQGQTVGLSIVDDALHVISNRYRLTTDSVRKKMLYHNLESFINLKEPNKLQFRDGSYDIHSIQSDKKEEVLVVLDNISVTSELELEDNSEVGDLPKALPQKFTSGSKQFKYDHFPASKLFKTYNLSTSNVTNVSVTLPDSLTRWRIQAISLSKTRPFCVLEPPPIITFKYIVHQLLFPQYVKKYGMFEIKFILYNYGHKNVKVKVKLNKTKYICSKQNRINVNVPSSGLTVSKFLAYAMHTGDVPVSVTIEYNHDTDGDRTETIEKIISIRDHQISKPKILTFFLEKSDGIDDSTVSGMTCNERDVLGDIVKTTLQEPEKLLQKSHGSSNQNIIYMAMSVYVLKYILNMRQMNKEIYNNGTKFIRMGIEKQNFFQKNDGSYSNYPDTKSSVWLTAFVLKIFCQANEIEEIDKDLTRRAIFWLLNQQNQDGSFQDNSYVHRDIMGGRSTLELTAFVLISLMECMQMHAKEIYANGERINLSMFYLENNLDSISDKRTLAITTYALTLMISNKRFAAWEKMTNGILPWQEQNSLQNPSPELVLISSYALLIQLQYDEITTAFPIFNWLIKQKDENGMFSSTQNTVIALQALAEYAIKWNAPDLDLKLILPNATINMISFFEKTNTSEGSTENQIKMSSIGVRSTYVQVLTDFKIFNTKEKNCHFDISYKMRKDSPQINSTHSLNITLKYNGKLTLPNPVMEVDLITGYYMNNNILKTMESLNFIKKIEDNGESALTFFLRKLEPGEQLTFNLILQRGNERQLTPSSIKVYNNDKLDESCVILYPKEKYFSLFCDNNECLCPGNCPTTTILEQEEIKKIFCKPNQIGIKVKILHKKKGNITEEQKKSRIIYSAIVEQTLLNDSDDLEIKGAEVIINKKCSISDLPKGKYFIVTDKYMRTDTNNYKYWVDDYGFIISQKYMNQNLQLFFIQIQDLGKKVC